jgi:DGQHR domain-containing protein
MNLGTNLTNPLPNILLDNPNQLLVQKTLMGNSEAYLGAVTLEWLANRVNFACQLPLFQKKLDLTTNNIIRDAQTIEEIQQRPLDWSRQASLTQYLIAKKNHKFPALLVVISAPWVDNPDAPEWDEKKQAIQSTANFINLDGNHNIGLLDVSESLSIFALDGQHRLMGIQGLIELINTGKLPRYSKNKKPIGSPITLKDLRSAYQLDYTYLKSLSQEKIGIEFIPAVNLGETRPQAQQRIRSIFVHVNLMAVQLSKGQLALLNEDNGFSIIARRIAVMHPLFQEKEGRNPRVNWDGATIPAQSTFLTTLQALQDMGEHYLIHPFPHWKTSHKGLIPLRPPEEELARGLQQFSELFHYLSTLPSYQKLDQGIETPKLRRFPHERGGGEANILFRPIGQMSLVKALGILVFQKQIPLDTLCQKLRHYDANNGFSSMNSPQSLWYGILYDPNKKRVLVSGRDLAAKLIVYILGGMEDQLEIAYLRENLAQARTFGDKAISFQGTLVKPKEVGLPPKL